MEGIILGDCLDIMKKIEDKSIDLVVTDPPYKLIGGGDSDNRYMGNLPGGMLNRNSKNNRSGKMFDENEIGFDEWLPEIYRVLKEKTHAYIMINDRNMQEMLNVATSVGFKLVNILVWKKNNATPNKFYMKNCEFILMFRKGGERWINEMGDRQCIEIDNVIGKFHPTEKPVSLMEYLIKNSSEKGDLVLDPFSGSGAVGVACMNLGRRYIVIEKDEKYFNDSFDRIKNHHIQNRLF